MEVLKDMGPMETEHLNRAVTEAARKREEESRKAAGPAQLFPPEILTSSTTMALAPGAVSSQGWTELDPDEIYTGMKQGLWDLIEEGPKRGTIEAFNSFARDPVPFDMKVTIGSNQGAVLSEVQKIVEAIDRAKRYDRKIDEEGQLKDSCWNPLRAKSEEDLQVAVANAGLVGGQVYTVLTNSANKFVVLGD